MDLSGRSILVVEDEPLIALDIVDCLRWAGAAVLTAYNVKDGLRLAEHPELSAAVLDFVLSDGDGEPLCERLTQRAVPFVLYSGYRPGNGACGRGVHLAKPASREILLSTIGSIVREPPTAPA
jgi:CheY-like chemotaxis protein